MNPEENRLLDNHFVEIDRITRIKNNDQPFFSRQEAVKRQKRRFQTFFCVAREILLSSKPGKKEPFTTFFYFFSLFFLTFSDYQCIEIELINAWEKG